MSLPEPVPADRPHSHVSPRLPAAQARASAIDKVRAARDAVADAQFRHDHAAERHDQLSRRLAAIELEIADVERDRDQSLARLTSARQALEAAEARLQAFTRD